MNRQGWNNLLRGAGVFLGIALLVASWYFSASYFGIKKQELFWVGILVAVVVTFAEFAWRKPGLSNNTTFKAIGIICYLYDIFTNTLGILEAWGITSDYGKDIISVVMALAVGFIFAVIAEPMLSWGITGDAQADLISGVVNTLNGTDRDVKGNDGGGSNNNHGGGNQQKSGGRPEPQFHPMNMRDDEDIPPELADMPRRIARQQMGGQQQSPQQNGKNNNRTQQPGNRRNFGGGSNLY